MNKKQANAIISRHEELVVVSTYNILFTNDIACGQVIEAINVMKRTPFYKQKTKQLLNSVLKAQRDYESVLNSVIGDRCDFFANANESFCEEVMRHVEILYWCIKREFDRYALPYPPQLARMEVARTLCHFSCEQFDKRLEDLADTDPMFKRFRLDYMRLTNLARLLDETFRSLGIKTHVNLNTEEIKRAVDILTANFGNVHLIAKAISA